MGTSQSPHSSPRMGKSPGRFGAPRGPRQPLERFPGRRCYFGRVKQEGEGCRGKFNVPPAGPAPIQAGMKTIRGERAAEPPAAGPDPTGTGGTRGTRSGARRSPRGQNGVSRLRTTATLPPPSEGSFGFGMMFGLGSSQCSRGALQRPSCLSFPGETEILEFSRVGQPGKAQPWISGAGSGGRLSCRPHSAARPLHRLLPSAGGFPGC